MGTSINPPPTTDETTKQNDLNNNCETTLMDELVESPDHEGLLDSTGRILGQQPAFNKIINTEGMIQNGNEMVMGKDHDNPFLNTVTYDVEFSDGHVKEYGTNIIAKNMLTQVDLNCYSL